MKRAEDDVYDRPTEARGPAELQEGLGEETRPTGFVSFAEMPTGAATPGTLREDASQAFPVGGWDRYQFVGFLGEGGMGRVYKAFDPRLKRHVALKFIRGDDPELNRRFLAEAQAQARVDHPNVCKVHEVGEVEGRLYIALAFLDGEPLLAAARTMTLEEKVRVVRQVAEGLHAAHRIGLVHRDVKPGNVLVEKGEEGAHPYVMDFGLAREAAAEGMTVSGSVVGTPWYMSPEQALGRVHLLDRRSDVFSVGATLHELFTGRPPFEGQSAVDVLRRIVDEEAPPISRLVPGFPADLDTIVLKCLEKEPAHRYDSARALAEDLQRFLDGEPILARPLSLAGRLVKRARKNRALTAAIAAILFLVVGGTAASVRNAVVARRRTALAQSLGQEVKEIEVLMRFASYMLPLHDVSREKGIVRARLRELEERVAHLGAAGRGPGGYALGRGYLTLGEPEKAREHLLAAWNDGYRGPEMSYAMGLCLTRLWEKGVRGLTTAQSREEFERRKAELDETLKRPALLHLKDARGVRIDAPEMVSAVVADMEGDYDRAVAEAKRAADRIPWLYEARALEASATRRRADALRDKGEDAEALAEYQRAEAAHLATVEVGRSYPPAYQGLCTLYSEMMDLDWKRKLPPTEKFSRAAGWCEKAVTVEPGNNLAHLRLSDVYWRWAEYQTSAGEDPRPALEKSIAAAERTIRSGFDLAYTYDNLGIAWNQRANWEAQHGIDPSTSYAKAKEAYGVVLTRYPNLDSTYCNAAVVRASESEWLSSSGRDPTPLLHEARAIVAKGRTLAGRSCIVGSAAAIEVESLRWAFLSVGEVSAAFARAQAAAEVIRKANPTLAETELYAVRAHLWKARADVRGGRSPEEALAGAEGRLARLAELNGEAKEIPLFRAEILEVRALASRSSRGLAEAERLSAEARRKDPLGSEPLLVSARLLLRRGEARGALAMADRALAVNRSLAEAWGVRATALRALGRRREADESRRTALEKNPLVLTAWPGLG